MNASKPPDSVEDLVDLLRWRIEVASPQRGFRFLENGEGPEQTLTFRQLDRRARAIAARIRRQVEPGQRAILLYPPSLEYIEAFFGCLYAGVIAVPAYPPNPNRLERTLPRLVSIVDDSSASAALVTEEIRAMGQGLAAQTDQLADLCWIATDGVDERLHRDWSPPQIDGDSVAFLQYTSGSTGAPKGVVLDHRTLMRNEELIQQAFGSGPDDVGVNWLPLYHDMGLIGAVIQPVYCGCESVLMSPLDFLKRPARWLEAIDRYDGTKSTAPNFGYDLAVRKTPTSVRDQLDLSSWTVACNGAEPIRESTLRRFADYFAPSGFDESAFMPAYGLAEVGLIVSATPGDQTPRTVEGEDKNHVSCGRALGDFDVRIVDPDTGDELRQGEVGEVWLRRGSVAPGYWQNQQLNDETFEARLEDHQESFLKTGDLGFIDDGELVITGRLKDLIVIRGVNHYPQDIERTVESADPALRPGCGAAFSVDTGDDNEGLVVVHEVKPAEVDDVDELIGRIAEEIAGVHRLVPEEVVLIEPRTIEKTSSGKIQRFAVRESYQADELEVVARSGSCDDVDDTSADMPRRACSEIEHWLAGRVAEEAGIEQSGVDLGEPFSAFGIDSAAAVGIVGELEEWLGVEIPATALYDFPTIAALADHLGGHDDQQKSEDNPEVRRPASANSSNGTPPVAVVGMACRFPGADDLEQFWQLLCDGDDTIDVVPRDRWEPGTFTDEEIAGFDTMATDRGGYLENIDEFDAQFFGISPGEARAMDPQQRLVLETGWRAIEDAGLTSERLSGSATGVFIGQSAGDFARLYDGPPVRVGTGMAPSITANRLSYWLDLKGPSMTVDTACSSAMTALDQAVMNLRAGRCGCAIVGGVNAVLAPDTSVAFSRARMLSPSGTCRVFDEAADGYVRGDGCGVVVLKRLDDALDDGDRIRAVIRGIALNQDGQTNGLTAPNAGAHRAVIEEAIADAGVDPETIGAIEAHGTATEMGDAIESRALQQVFDGPPTTDQPRWLGSVKAAIGHLEAASGAAALIKAALMVERGRIVPQPNFDTPNRACDFEAAGLEVPTETTRWPGRDDGVEFPRRIGVNTFGFGGTNVHAVLEEPPPVSRSRTDGGDGGRAGLVTLAAEQPRRLEEMARRLLEHEALQSDSVSIRDIGWSLASHRDDGPVRFAVAAGDVGQLRERLVSELLESNRPTEEIVSTVEHRRCDVAFVFPRRDSQLVRASRQLFERSPGFRSHCEEVIDAVEQAGGAGVDEMISGRDNGERIDDPVIARPASFVVELALAKLLVDWGVVPQSCSGRGAGAVAAAHLNGDLSLREAADRVVAGEGYDDEDVAPALEKLDVDVVVELGSGQLRELSDRRDDSRWLVAAEGDGGVVRLMDVAGRLWMLGVACRRGAVNEGGQRVALPKTPYLRESYWPDEEHLRTITPGDG